MKKITITLTLCLAIVGGLQAQNDSWRAVHQAMGSPKNISFDASEVAYWVGSGDQSALLTIAWDNEATPTAYAWGVRWSGNITALGLLDTLKAYDTRINYYFSGSLLQWISYDDAAANEHHQGAAGLGFCYFLNGDWGNYTYDNCPIMDGDEVEISSTCMFTMTTAVAATNPNAPAPFVPSTTTIDSASILYWVGSGNQYAILAVNWPDTALAWGVRFNGGATTIKAVMDSIAAADPRFYFNGVNYIDAIHFVSGNDTIGVESDDTWMTSTNGVMNGGVSSMLVNGDLVRWFDWSSSPNPIYPVDTPSATPDEPSAEDATISSTDILYWVGSGDHSAILAVNWADTALAWGYRFSGDSVSLQSAMDDIATADPRFSYAGAGFVSDIHF
ncbi:MAG: hypothetical protein SPJ13_01660, partial [Bacteroidales bacterium]|nr:hypothetical protein [Bacteroidales bacterium]